MGQGRLLLLLLAAALLAAADSSDFDDDDDATLGASGAVTDAITIEGSFPNEQLVQFQQGKVFRVLLNGGVQQAPVRSDGSFAVYDVREGVHTLEVDAPGWYFEQIKLDVRRKGTQLKARATFNGESGGGKVLAVPLQLHPATRHKYFEEREKFDPTVYLKNPMVLMGLMAALMAFVMPKMVENMDPEERKKIQDDFKKGGHSGLMKSAFQEAGVLKQ